MTAKRTVRADQHGTETGYGYGCRCHDCRVANRVGLHVSDETTEKVLAAIEREADLDGLITASQQRLGELASVSQQAASNAVRRLVAEGRVRAQGRRVGARGACLVLELVDGAR